MLSEKVVMERKAQLARRAGIPLREVLQTTLWDSWKRGNNMHEYMI